MLNIVVVLGVLVWSQFWVIDQVCYCWVDYGVVVGYGGFDVYFDIVDVFYDFDFWLFYYVIGVLVLVV